MRWSGPRMTLCAGLCKYRFFLDLNHSSQNFHDLLLRGRAGGCEIVLSVPLLQFRSSKELKETLLHEMIHALLFVTKFELVLFSFQNSFLTIFSHNDNHDDHGPNFKNLMVDINTSSVSDQFRPSDGYNISVYHNFVDEVNYHRQHHWKCDRCQRVKKRSMNRPPSEKDCLRYRKDESGWIPNCPPDRNRCGLSRCDIHDHMRECGGQWVKVQEPSQKIKRKESSNREESSSSNSHLPKKQKKIDSFFSEDVVPEKLKEPVPERGNAKAEKVLIDLTVPTESSLEFCSDEHLVEILVEMGFEKEFAQKALERCANNLSEAISHLIGN